MVRHLFQRTITYKGKKIKAWYYWYYDKNGKQIKKTCGKNRIPCTVKREAQALIAELTVTDSDLKAASTITFQEAVKDFYKPNSAHLNRLEQRGHNRRETSLQIKQYVLNRILKTFGSRQINSITEREIELYLLNLELKNASKNQYLFIFKEIYEDLKFRGLVENRLTIKTFRLKSYSTKGILTKDEIKKLFPDNFDELYSLWNKLFTIKSKIPADKIATLCFVALTSGMRLGEVVALQYNQFIKEDTILINAMITGKKRVNYLKKGSDENKKWRVVIIPEKAVKMIERLKQKYPHDKDDYLFIDKPTKLDKFNKYFKSACNYIGIDTEIRNISFHSLRFTNDTYSKREMTVSDIQLMLGHSSPIMTEYYDRATALDKLPSVERNRETINSLWN